MDKLTIISENKISPAKKQILEAAAELFREKGYAATSVRELAQKVGLEASSLYSHIKSKEQILVEICMDNAFRFTKGIAAIEQACLSSKERLQRLIRLHVDIASEGISSVMVFNDEWRHMSEPYQGEFLRMRKEYEQKVLFFIEEGIKNGELKEVEPKIALYSFLTALRWVHYRIKPGKISKEKLYQNLQIILIDGLGK